MGSRRWETVLRQILGVLGAGIAPLGSSVSCGNATTETARTGGGGGVPANTGGSAAGAARSTGGIPFLIGTGGFAFPTGGFAGVLSDGSDGKLPTYRVSSTPPNTCTPAAIRRLPIQSIPGGANGCAGEAAASNYAQAACVDRPADAGSCAAINPLCMVGEFHCGLAGVARFVCGPLPDSGNECCYWVIGDCAVGRPFLVGGRARTAALAPGRSDWTTEHGPNLAALEEDARAALADAYSREGLSEHASVAAFARFTLQCLALGAPADVVRDAVSAGLDEVEHARLCFGLASAYAGHDIGPGPLDVTGAMEEVTNLERIACGVAREGCIAETISALLLAAARDAAEDVAVKATLARIAAEELEHALLAWRFVQWASEMGGPAVRSALARVFASAAEYVGFGAVTSLPAPEPALRAHGYLSIAERRTIATAALREVIAPAADALLHSRPANPAPRARDHRHTGRGP